MRGNKCSDCAMWRLRGSLGDGRVVILSIAGHAPVLYNCTWEQREGYRWVLQALLNTTATGEYTIEFVLLKVSTSSPLSGTIATRNQGCLKDVVRQLLRRAPSDRVISEESTRSCLAPAGASPPAFTLEHSSDKLVQIIRHLTSPPSFYVHRSSDAEAKLVERSMHGDLLARLKGDRLCGAIDKRMGQ